MSSLSSLLQVLDSPQSIRTTMHLENLHLERPHLERPHLATPGGLYGDGTFELGLKHTIQEEINKGISSVEANGNIRGEGSSPS